MTIHSLRTPQKKSLRLSIYDGFFYSLMVGFGETYFSVYALFLGANNVQLGVLSALPPFLAGLAQFATVSLMKRFPSRRGLLCVCVLVQALLLIPLCMSHAFSVFNIEIYILFVILFLAAGSMGGPIWNSWMGDLVEPEQRGQYFGLRNRIITIGTFASMILAGFTLRYFKDVGIEVIGFYLIFGAAFVARAISCFCLSRKTDIEVSEPETNPSGFWEFTRHLLKRNQGILILYMACINFAVFMSAAFFTPYLLKTLNYSYATYTLVISGVALTKFLTSPFWGEICDTLGNRRVLLWTGLMVPFSTVPWIFSGDAVVIFMAQCFSGFLWAGYELATFNFLLDATRPSERARISSYSSIIISVAALLGGISGIVIVHNSPVFFHAFGIVFLASALVRLAAFFLFARKLKEVRVISPVRTRDVVFKATGFKSAVGLTSRLVVLNTRRLRPENLKVMNEKIGPKKWKNDYEKIRRKILP